MCVVQKRGAYDWPADARPSCGPRRTDRGQGSTQGPAGSLAVSSVLSRGRRSNHAAAWTVDPAAAVSFHARFLSCYQ